MGFTSFEQVDNLTIAEYEIIEKAISYKDTDLDYRNHLQAFLNFTAKATRKGKPVYKNFKQFYDYEAAQREITEKKQDRFSSLKAFLRKGNNSG